MSLFDSLHIAVSGVSAQANQLSAISTNIANATTTGYKNALVHFDTVMGDTPVTNYNIDGVQTSIRYGAAGQGGISTTTSSTDLAINGDGFFLVKGTDGGTALTRAGSFVADANGNLVNTAGYTLMGYSLQGGGSGSLAPVTVPGGAATLSVGRDGTISTVNSSGATVSLYRVALANVESPDNLTSLSANVYEPSSTSGGMTIGTAGSGVFGAIDSSALESSTVDIATELTNMIVAQRGYEANSKVMTTSSDMMSKLFDAATVS